MRTTVCYESAGFALVAALGMWVGSAAAQCVVPTDGMVITADTTFCPGNYVLPNGITIAADDVTLDGAGAVIRGSSAAYGVTATNRDNLTIRNLTVRGYDRGMHLYDCDGLTIEDCNVWDTPELPEGDIFLNIFAGPNGSYSHAIWLRYCDDATIQRCNVEDQQNGISLFDCQRALVAENEASFNTGWGITLHNTDHSIIRDNRADYCTRLYGDWSGADAASLLMVYGSSNNEILDNSLVGGGDGVFLAGATHSLGRQPNNYNYFRGNDCSYSPNNGFEATFSQYNVFEDNISDFCNYGYWCGYSSFNEIRGNQINNNITAGIAIEHGNNNVIEQNTLADNAIAVQLWTDQDNSLVAGFPELADSFDTTIRENEFRGNTAGVACSASGTNRESYGYQIVGNVFTENVRGVSFVNSTDSTIRGNYFYDNTHAGLQLARSDRNTVYDNYFRNPRNAITDDSSVTWHVAKTAGPNTLGRPWLGGNYWSDYAGSDTDGDWLGDTQTPHDSSGYIDGPGDAAPLLWDDPDCNGNGVPDAAEPDCNDNGTPDACDIVAGLAVDCDGNGVPDTCDLADGAASDCNGNGIPDSCDLADGTALDCNGNGIPDACDLVSGVARDCDGNGLPDSCDILAGRQDDCNADGVPDECQLADGSARDCNANGVPDSCDLAGAAPTLTDARDKVLGWREISATGTALNLGDDELASVTLPFTNFVFADTHVIVSNNGALGFGGASQLAATNDFLPAPDAFGGAQALFAYWDDIDSDTGNVYWHVLGTAPQRTFIVEWYIRPLAPGDSLYDDDEISFQVQLFETPVDGIYAQVLYFDLDALDPARNDGASATVGYQRSASSAVEWSYNTAGGVTRLTTLSLVAHEPVATDANGNGVPDACDGRLGDVNCDGLVDTFDIDPFILALSGSASYEPAYPDCDMVAADINGDGVVDTFDIDPFIGLLGAE